MLGGSSRPHLEESRPATSFPPRKEQDSGGTRTRPSRGRAGGLAALSFHPCSVPAAALGLLLAVRSWWQEVLVSPAALKLSFRQEWGAAKSTPVPPSPL